MKFCASFFWKISIAISLQSVLSLSSENKVLSLKGFRISSDFLKDTYITDLL